MIFLFVLIGFLASLIGSLFGIGGGIIIKPALGAASDFSMSYINALSGITVLSMSAVSLLRYLHNGEKLTMRVVWISAGAVFGGFAGKYLFELTERYIPAASGDILQYSLLTAMLAVALLRKHVKSFSTHNQFALLASGLFMGTLSSFLGIGGGPINLFVLYVVLGADQKQATPYSIFVVLCSQLANLSVAAVSGGYAGFDAGPLLFLIPAAVTGGLIGPSMHRRLDIAVFERHYNTLLVALIALNLYNIINVII